MRTVTCMCDKTIDADLPDVVDLDAAPDERDRILDGSFFSLTCPHCGTLLKPELSVRVRSASSKLDALVLPEGDRVSFYDGAVEVPAGCEVLVGYAELVERVAILRDGYEPFAVEVVKYFLLGKAVEAAPDADIVVTYHGTEEGKLVFYIVGMKSDETGVVRVPLATYDDIAKDAAGYRAKAPFDAIAKGPYKSVNVLETLE